MRELDIQQREYPFARLDELVEVRLNQLMVQEFQDIADEDLAEIRVLFVRECDKVWANLKAIVFGLLSEEEIRTVITHHLLIIDHLKKQIQEGISGSGAPSQTSYYAMLTNQLDSLESLIRARYTVYCPIGSPVIHYKILCTLSVDQIGLILKAADDIRIIQARSLSQVFKSIVPYLSTPNKIDISFDSMRASTYHPETTDKEKAIAALERMISKIKDYR
jgi:hypothetical protein